MKTAVIIPAENHEKTISSVIADFSATLPDSDIIIVESGSQDNTLTMITKAQEELKGRCLLIREPRPGRMISLRTALAKTRADVIIIAEAAGSFSAMDALKMHELVANGDADLVLGQRTPAAGRTGLKTKTMPYSRLFRTLFGIDLNDPQTPFCAMSNRLVRHLPLAENPLDFNLYRTAFALSSLFRVVEIPALFRHLPGQKEDRQSPFRAAVWHFYQRIWLVKENRPLMLFSSASLAVVLFGVLNGIPAFFEFITLRYVVNIPSAIVAVSFILFGMVLFAIGLIIDAVNSSERKNRDLSIRNS